MFKQHTGSQKKENRGMKEREGREKIKQQNQELRFPSGIHMIWDACQRLEGVAFCILPKIQLSAVG